jgi:hypothetical protein
MPSQGRNPRSESLVRSAESVSDTKRQDGCLSMCWGVRRCAQEDLKSSQQCGKKRSSTSTQHSMRRTVSAACLIRISCTTCAFVWSELEVISVFCVKSALLPLLRGRDDNCRSSSVWRAYFDAQ